MAEITRESEFAYKIAEEYRKKGYTIITHVTPADLQPLGIDFTVDALARNDTETVVIEIVSRPKLDTMPDYFRELHHAVNNTEGWRLDAGVISSLDKNPLPPIDLPTLRPDAIRGKIQQAREHLYQRNLESAFHEVWEAAEAMFRLNIESDEDIQEEKIQPTAIHPIDVIVLLIHEGYLVQKDHDPVMQGFEIQYRLDANQEVEALTQEFVETLIALVDRMISETGFFGRA